MLNQNCRIGEAIFYCSYFQILFTFLYIVYIKIEASSSVCQKTICFQTEKNKSKETKKTGSQKPILATDVKIFSAGDRRCSLCWKRCWKRSEVEQGKRRGESCYCCISFSFALPKDIVIDNKLNLFSLFLFCFTSEVNCKSNLPVLMSTYDLSYPIFLPLPC